ncbi:MAG TPA: 5'-nucleotidase, partial [Gaiellaceae bacterium]|nr:5'-nucleotidase [Gaiellaceae bacterium]
GDIIADAQLAATADPLFGGSVVAFMNPGGIRNDLPAGPLTYGQLFSVQPFNNVLTVMTCTGAQLDALLEQQFENPNPTSNRILQVSEGFSYTWDMSEPKGSKVDIASIAIDGTPISPLASYRVTLNNFIATGGDGFSTFLGCTNPLGGEIDLDAFVRYVDEGTPPGISPGPQNRISVQP